MAFSLPHHATALGENKPTTKEKSQHEQETTFKKWDAIDINKVAVHLTLNVSKYLASNNLK